MSIRPVRLVMIALLVMAGATVYAIDEPLTLSSAVEMAVAADSEIAQLERDRDDQLDALGWGRYRDALSFSLSGSIGGSAGTPLSAGGSSQLDASVALLPQLTLTGGLTARIQSDGATTPGSTDPLSGSVGLSLRPLADAHGTDRDELALRNTEAEISRAVMQTSSQALGTLLDAVDALEAYSLSSRALSVAELRQASTEALYSRDRATEQERDQAESNVRTASQQVQRDEITARRAVEKLSQATAVTVTDEMVPSWADLGLEELIESAIASRETLTPELLAEDAGAVETASQEVESAQIALASERRFTPDLSIGASASYPNFSYQVTAELTISPSDFNGEGVSDAQRQLSTAQQQHDYAMRSARIDAESALLEFDIAVTNVDVAREKLSDANDALAETQFRYCRGDVTEVDVRDAELSVASAENGYQSALATALRRWATIEYRQY